MCTLAKHVGIFDGCFCEEQLDGTNSYGNCFCGQNCLQCTRNKQFLSSDVNPYDAVIPPVEDLSCRSGCCCLYFGYTCKPEHRPVGSTLETTCCCTQTQCGLLLQTAPEKKRTCLGGEDVMNCLTCEEQSQGEFIVMEESCEGNCCCCWEGGGSNKVSCCPTPMTCYGCLGQCCCLYFRLSFPCNDTTPCEVGCCSLMCMNKIETIKEAEAALREKARASEAVEAVIIEKGGSPAEVMER